MVLDMIDGQHVAVGTRFPWVCQKTAHYKEVVLAKH
jgi:hypothetical protein